MGESASLPGVLLIKLLGLVLLMSGVLMGLTIPAVGPYPGVGRVELAGIAVSLTLAVLGLFLAVDRETPWVTRLARVPSPLLWILIILSAAVGLLSAAALYGTREKGADFIHDRTTGTRKVITSVLEQAGILGTGVCRCEPDREDRLFLPGGFETRVSIYDRGGTGPRPGVVLLHGNTWYGRKLSIYRLVASSLAEEGYIVLTFDYVGKGESDDPFRYGPTGLEAAFDFPAQTNAGIDYLLEHEPVDPDNVSVLGHSAGADWAEFVGLTNEAVARVALMVAPPPPDLAGEDPGVETPGGTDRYVETYSFIYGKPAPDWYQRSMRSSIRRDWKGVQSLMEAPGHKPLLVLLGERDQPEGHAAVRLKFERIAEPKTLVLIDRSDHYGNSAQALGLVFFDRAVARQLVGEISSWIARTSTLP